MCSRPLSEEDRLEIQANVLRRVIRETELASWSEAERAFSGTGHLCECK